MNSPLARHCPPDRGTKRQATMHLDRDQSAWPKTLSMTELRRYLDGDRVHDEQRHHDARSPAAAVTFLAFGVWTSGQPIRPFG